MSEVPELDMPWMTEQAMGTLIAAAEGDLSRAARLVSDVGERYGHHGVYCLCCALAESIGHLGGYRDSGGDFWGLQVQTLTGRLVEPEDVGPDTKPLVTAMRFVVAVLNRDADQSMALFSAGLNTPQEVTALPAGLIKLAEVFGRQKLEESRG